MNKQLQTIIWVVIVLLVIWAVYALSQNTPEEVTGPATGEPIKIGWLGPLTGDAAAYGEPMQNVSKLALEEINASGGINGNPIEFIYEDAKCTGSTAASAMQKLANVDKVQAVLGGLCSSESLAAIPVAESSQVFLFSAASSSPDLTGINDYFARNYPSDAAQGAVLANLAYNQMGWTEVAFIQEQMDYPLGIFKAFEKEFISLGGTVTNEQFATALTDFRTILAKIKAQDPDAVFVDPQTPAAGERILQQMANLNWAPNLLVADVLTGATDVVKENAELLEGAFGAEFGINPENEKFQHMITAYQEKFGEEVPFQSYAQTYYDAVYMLRDAIVEVGYDGTKIAEWFKNVNGWQGASGPTTLIDGDPAVGHVPKIIRNGKTELYTD